MRRAALSLILSAFFLGTAWAEDPVHFSDPKLKAAVEEELGFSDPTPTDMLGLTSLYIPLTWQRIDAISDLSGLGYAHNLTELNLRYHTVSDLSPLSGLTHLKSLVLLANRITNVSPLSGLVELESLDLESNEVSDISALSGLVSLSSLCLHRNFVSDISPLTSLTSLHWLDLRALPLSESAYSTYIPQIEENNPGITVLYDGFFAGQLVISSSIGGSVVTPGEGTFSTVFGDSYTLEAQADPGFVFAGWSGSYATTQNPLPLTIDQDYTLRANFVSLLRTIHVDDDAPADPGPCNPAVSDPQENGTAAHPFDGIRKALDVVADGATIFVRAGAYRETLEWPGKTVALTGFDPNEPGVCGWPVIDGGGSGPVVSFTHNEDPCCVLSGFVITGGKGRTAGAIRCMASSPTIANCLIAGNRATEWNGAAILCTDSDAVFTNCTIVDNRGGQFGAALSTVNRQITVANSILWGNWPKEVDYEGQLLPVVRYCTVASGWFGQGDIKADPLFVSRGRWVDGTDPNVTVKADDPSAVWVMGDYHLQSQAGCRESGTGQWRLDSVTSPCIDAGDPATPVGSEPLPNAGIINMGAYGGTAEASRSSSPSQSP
ncbi:MAG: hypothetical protein JW955_09255 [Sedimentisphaerales bacterium]|nr:hypothetical protein [Sedimentisphaerales bacterium]